MKSTCTEDHRWLTTNGYVTSDRLSDADHIIVEGPDASFDTDAVFSVKKVGTREVYDVEMESGTDHNFVANGMVSHNSHSAPYAYLAYIEAYLKANWPAYFGAALLSVKESVSARLSVLHSIRRSGVTVLGPDINESGLETRAVDDHTIRLGLGEIRGVRSNAEALVAEREANGAFADLHDLITRVEEEKTTKRNVKNADGEIVDTVSKTVTQKMSLATIETLIDAGACDSFGHPRRGMNICVRALRFAPDVEVPNVEYGDIERAVRERRGLGIVTSTHPTALIRDAAIAAKVTPATSIASLRPNPQAVVMIDAVIAHVLIKRGQSGKQRAHLVLEDYSGATEAVMWSNSLDEYAAKNGAPPAEGDIVTAKVMVKTMTRVIESDDDAADLPEGDDAAVMEEERLDVIIKSITKRTDLDFGGERELDAVVRHPLHIPRRARQEAPEAVVAPQATNEAPEPPEALSEAHSAPQEPNEPVADAPKEQSAPEPVEDVTIHVPTSILSGSTKLKRWLVANHPDMAGDVVMWFVKDARATPASTQRGPHLGYTLVRGDDVENDE